MKIAIVTCSRADKNALGALHSALVGELVDGERGNIGLQPLHQLIWIDDICSPRPAESMADTASLLATVIMLATDKLMQCQPDLVVLHGDRFETLAVAVAANCMSIPIAHLGGGDITEGSQDDCFRHAITKLSHLHFASNADSAARIMQMGEEPGRVFATGDPGIDAIYGTQVLGYDRTFDAVGFSAPPERCLLVVFHPNTLGDTAAELEALVLALCRRPINTAIVLIGPNGDAGRDRIHLEWERTIGGDPTVRYHESVSPCTFYSLMRWCSVMVGNSSAAYYEASMYGLASVDIGNRQRGRANPGNVLCVPPDAQAIVEAIKLGMTKEVTCDRSMYGDGHAAMRICKIISEIKNSKALLQKSFTQRVPLKDEWLSEAAARLLP